MQRVLVLAILVVIGCSKGGSDSSARRMPGAGPAAQPETAENVAPEQPGEPVHEGQPLSAWVEQFQQKEDASARAKAATALAQLGEDGYPALLQALQSKADDARILALQAVTRETLVRHEADTLPLLRKMVTDPNATIRKQAAERLSWYDVKNVAALKETVRLLRQVAQNDPLPEVREVANGALRSITTAYTGRPVAGAPDDPVLPF